MLQRFTPFGISRVPHYYINLSCAHSVDYKESHPEWKHVRLQLFQPPSGAKNSVISERRKHADQPVLTRLLLRAQTELCTILERHKPRAALSRMGSTGHVPESSAPQQRNSESDNELRRRNVDSRQK